MEWHLEMPTRFASLPWALVRYASCQEVPIMALRYTSEEIPGSTATS